ncbi:MULTISPECIES: ABC transporter permease [Streptococcus]|uniref:ABC transporter permease n=1 Tax=Streptococcus TaxID=1301 RepID=UPI00045923A7|nr:MULTISPECIES: ABC transporter permease [Streptococcus]AHZ48506.1 multidrug ABC transporter permease [Streptococcus sp. VT 162]MBN6013286.1 ABC transporter permease [Streptococcus oralis subsp. oralis]OFL48794.1 multidrug ABC transporter permease [Streptococcus sp. HMSC076C08]OFP33800.1 multidrug ABC transporter permease [Streptococcus sp. HMSC072D07]
MLALLKRNFILYFRNRSGVFFSLLGALISFLLYIIFLQKNLTDSWSQLPNSTNLLNNWLMGGTLAVTGMTTSFTALKQMVQDRENQVNQDLFLTDLGNWGLQASYLISSIVISFVMQIFMYAVMSFYFKESPVISHLPEIALIMLLSSLLSSLVNVLLIYRFQSVDSLGKLATIVGTASGFLVGTYIPIGVLPDFAQIIMKCTPATYIASLYRQVLMKERLEIAFSGNNSLLQEFQEKMGIQINWQELLTKEETYFIVVIISLIAILLWLLFVKVFSKRK